MTLEGKTRPPRRSTYSLVASEAYCMLDDLRHRIRAIERPATFAEGTAALSLGVPEVDALLGGGFARGALHEIAALSEAHLPTATGFVVGLGQAVCGATVWLAEDMG